MIALERHPVHTLLLVVGTLVPVGPAALGALRDPRSAQPAFGLGRG